MAKSKTFVQAHRRDPKTGRFRSKGGRVDHVRHPRKSR